jgi:hypothetical protein
VLCTMRAVDEKSYRWKEWGESQEPRSKRLDKYQVASIK